MIQRGLPIVTFASGLVVGAALVAGALAQAAPPQPAAVPGGIETRRAAGLG